MKTIGSLIKKTGSLMMFLQISGAHFSMTYFFVLGICRECRAIFESTTENKTTDGEPLPRSQIETLLLGVQDISLVSTLIS